MTKLGALLRPQWVAAVAIATLVTACGLPSSLPVPRPARSNGAGQLTDEQQLKLAAMQRLFSLLNATQRDGQTLLTTRITQSGTADGHRQSPRDYALGKVSPAQATLDFSWHFTDPPTKTNASGTIRLDHLTVFPGTLSQGGPATVGIQFGYAASSDVERGASTRTGSGNSPQRTLQWYSRPHTGSQISPPEDSGSIHVAVVPLANAIRSVMSLQQNLSITEASGRTYRVGRVEPNQVNCKLSRSDQSRARDNLVVEAPGAPPVVWSVDDSPDGAAYRGPGTYLNQHIFMTNGTVPGTVVVNPDQRSGTLTGSQPGPISGVDAVSGTFLCAPRSMEPTLESYS